MMQKGEGKGDEDNDNLRCFKGKIGHADLLSAFTTK
jgi:hypothetical protein